MAAQNFELSNAIDAALAALDDADFQGCSSPSLLENDDWECQLQMKVQVFSPPPQEDEDSSSEASSSEASTAASENQSQSQSVASKWKGKAGALASSMMPRLKTV